VDFDRAKIDKLWNLISTGTSASLALKQAGFRYSEWVTIKERYPAFVDLLSYRNELRLYYASVSRQVDKSEKAPDINLRKQKDRDINLQKRINRLPVGSAIRLRLESA